MLPLLIVAATAQEINPLLGEMELLRPVSQRLNYYRFMDLEIGVLITGVGLVATAFELGRELKGQKFELAINLGIAGSFNPNIRTGEVVQVISDQVADLGAQDGEGFLDIFDLKLAEADAFPFEDKWLVNNYPSTDKEVGKLKKVKGISVNQVHGEENAIRKVMERLNPDVESMEGAAFFYACFQEAVPCLQIRGISNKVEPRNRENWDIPRAIKTLNETAIKILRDLKIT